MKISKFPVFIFYWATCGYGHKKNCHSHKISPVKQTMIIQACKNRAPWHAWSRFLANRFCLPWYWKQYNLWSMALVVNPLFANQCPIKAISFDYCLQNSTIVVCLVVMIFNQHAIYNNNRYSLISIISHNLLFEALKQAFLQREQKSRMARNHGNELVHRCVDSMKITIETSWDSHISGIYLSTADSGSTIRCWEFQTIDRYRPMVVLVNGGCLADDNISWWGSQWYWFRVLSSFNYRPPVVMLIILWP